MPGTRAGNKRPSNTNEHGNALKAPPAKKQKIENTNSGVGMKRRSQDIVIDLEANVPRVILRKIYSKFNTRDEFPRFHQGTVYIQLAEGDRRYCYIFDKVMIVTQSQRLATVLEKHIREVDPELAAEVKQRENLEACLSLQYVSTAGTWALVRVPFTKSKTPDKEHLQNSVTVKTAKSPQQSQPKVLQGPIYPDSTPSARHAGLQMTSGPSRVERVDGPSQKSLIHVPVPSTNQDLVRSNTAARTTVKEETSLDDSEVKEETLVDFTRAIKKEPNEEAPTHTGSIAFSSPSIEFRSPDMALNKGAENNDMPAYQQVAHSPTGVDHVTTTPLRYNPSNATAKSISIPKWAPYAHGEASSSVSTETKKLEESSPKHEIGSQAYFHAVHTHRALFQMFHNILPEVDSSSVDKALNRLENLMALSELYKCTAIVTQNRHFFSKHMLQFGRELFNAILEDPPRWIQLSIWLECAPIFKEAMVHLVGQYPYYPWTAFPSSRLQDSPKSFHRQRLFLSDISINHHNLTLPDLDRSNFDTWLIVQLWRDWFCHSLSKHSRAKHQSGAVYRLMARGGNAYLDVVTVYTHIMKLNCETLGSWTLEGIEEDLNIMKEFAQKKVRDLVVNHSMLDIEDAGIQHLTCIKVENDELPWAKKDIT